MQFTKDMKVLQEKKNKELKKSIQETKIQLNKEREVVKQKLSERCYK